MRSPTTVVRLLTLMSLSGLLPSCAIDPGPPKNLLLITVDTLRPDRLGFSGHDRNTSPAIDRLAAEGVRFQTTYSQAGWTLPAVATLLTGRYPSEHGAVELDYAMDPDVATLATLLGAAAYQTIAYVSHVMLSPEHGLAEGFDIYDDSILDVGHPHKVSTAEALTDRVLETLPSRDSPFFLWVHYFDPHFDYMSHAGWDDWGSTKIDLYDSEIAYMDHQIGRLTEELAKNGLMDNTVTILTADHGEAFGERGTWHHFSMYEEVLRVPLVIHGPSIKSGISDLPAQQIDLVPTVLGLLALDSAEDLPGQDLFARGIEPREILAERNRPAPFIQRTVICGTDKLIRIELTANVAESPERIENAFRKTKIRPGIYLFDLENDPLERVNLYTPENPKAIELLSLLDQHFDTDETSSKIVPIDAETRDKLHALGYLD